MFRSTDQPVRAPGRAHLAGRRARLAAAVAGSLITATIGMTGVGPASAVTTASITTTTVCVTTGSSTAATTTLSGSSAECWSGGHRPMGVRWQ
jgi:hypothetical protein